MDCCESRTSPDDIAPRAAARRRLVRGLGLLAEIRARRRRPRSAADRRDPARRARRPRHRGADRRSRLCRPARCDRAGHPAVRMRRCRSIRSSRCIRRCRNSRGCTATKHAAVVHAVATPYRDRSHFDGQDVLESGFAGPGRVQSGWLNRALEALAARRAGDERARHRSDHAAGAARRRADVGWAPAALPQADDDTATRLVDLYAIAIRRWRRRCRKGLQLDKSRAGRRHEAEARHQRRRRDAAGGARRRQADGGR